MSEFDSGGKGSGGKKGNGSSFWDGLRSLGQGIVDGFTSSAGTSGPPLGSSRKPDRKDPLGGERRVAAAQVRRSLKAWRDREEAETIQRKPQIPSGGGNPLPGGVKSKMEGKLGADLSAVKVHTGGDSEKASEDLNAKAFTVGDDVHFGSGQFDPSSKEGEKLLAHELTHVVQGQKGGVQRKEESDDAEGPDGEAMEVSEPDEPAEKEADEVSEKVVEGDNANDEKEAPSEAAASTVHRSAKQVVQSVGSKIHRVSNADKAKIKELAEKDAKTLLEAAAKNEEAITSSMQSIAGANGGTLKGLEHRLKELDSMARKITDRAIERMERYDKTTVEKAVKKAVEKINDALRYTMELSPDGFRKAGAAIKAAAEGKSFTVTAERNFWDTAVVEDFPYRGVNMTLKSPEGQIFELQFHTPDSLAMKSELHGLYEEWRKKETPAPRKAAIKEIMSKKWKTVPVPT